MRLQDGSFVPFLTMDDYGRLVPMNISYLFPLMARVLSLLVNMCIYWFKVQYSCNERNSKTDCMAKDTCAGRAWYYSSLTKRSRMIAKKNK
jgi:hypothetical protein